MVLFLFSFGPLANTANAQSNETQINLSTIKNVNAVLNELSQNENDIISSYWLDETVKNGVINIHNEKEDKYYNFYIENNLITYYSVQYYIDENNEDANFELYTVTKNNKFNHEFTSTIVKETGKVNHQIQSRSVSDSVYKWACIFSSRLACIAAAGTLGFGVAGPFGATAAVAACSYVFGTLVEKYGSKNAACKIFS